jgi:hypothetical protein
MLTSRWSAPRNCIVIMPAATSVGVVRPCQPVASVQLRACIRLLQPATDLPGAAPPREERTPAQLAAAARCTGGRPSLSRGPGTSARAPEQERCAQPASVGARRRRALATGAARRRLPARSLPAPARRTSNTTFPSGQPCWLEPAAAGAVNDASRNERCQLPLHATGAVSSAVPGELLFEHRGTPLARAVAGAGQMFNKPFQRSGDVAETNRKQG